jgi:tetratricopeptide (TPR) repeat protein
MRKLMLALIFLAMAALFVPRAAVAAPTDEQKPTALSDMTVAQLEERGDLARIRKDYRGAMDFYRAALKKEPKSAVLYNKIGICELLMEELGAARADFEKALKRNKNYAEALNNIGAVYHREKNYSKAIRYYKKALALNEANASFHMNLGTAWFSQKQYERTISEYVRALELDPEVLARNERGGTTARMLNAEDRANYAFLLARLYAKRGDLDRCLEFLKKAKEEGYGKLMDVYTDPDFATMRADARLAELIPPPPPKQ